MASVLDIITDAHIELGIASPGDVLTADDANFGLRTLARLQDQWAAERLTIYTITRTTKVLTASDGEYSVGSGGDINITRPVFIDAIHLIDTSVTPNVETPLTKLTEAEYRDIRAKAQTATQPDSWYYNPTFPTGTLYLFPIQTGSYSIALYAPTQLTENTALVTTVSLPPGYREMLVTNLAVRLAPSYRVPVSPDLRFQASHSKGANIRPAKLTFADSPNVGDGGSYDIRNG
jgi:hypothetical protein